MSFNLDTKKISEIMEFLKNKGLYLSNDTLILPIQSYKDNMILGLSYKEPDTIIVIYRNDDIVDIYDYNRYDHEDIYNEIVDKVDKFKRVSLFDDVKKEQPRQDTTNYTIKYDQNKHKLSQFPREAMEAVCEIMEYGARKYGGGTWSRVEIQRYVDAATRHLYAMQDIDENGKECINLAKKDEESGMEHLYHLACNVVYAVTLYRREKSKSS